MKNSQISPIIEVHDLLSIYGDPNVLIFDVRNVKDAKSHYETEHLHGAFFVDLNSQLADIKSDFADGGRHPLPRIEDFARTLSELGISPEKQVIIYDDNNGSNAAARFWWMLKAVGHKQVQVLNGGLHQARKGGFPMNSGIETPKVLHEPYPVSEWMLPTIEMSEVEKVARDAKQLVIDVRDRERYEGKTEPIDLVAGHIPGAVNVPFTGNLDDEGRFLCSSDLKAKYMKLFGEIMLENSVVHCGSGVTACHTLLALDYAGFEIPKLYVGSWSEWSRNEKEIATGTH